MGDAAHVFDYNRTMFEISVDELDAEATARQLDATRLAARRVGAHRMQLAAHWADLHAHDPHRQTLHGPDRPDAGPRAGQPRMVRLGGDGTPEIHEFAAAELGCYLDCSPVTATVLLRDALDLRHRHPRHWQALLGGEVEDWKVRAVARATREAGLDLAQAHWVDAEVLHATLGLPATRALLVLEAKIIAADPVKAEERRKAAEQRRYVATGRRNPQGLQTLIAQTTPADVHRIIGAVDHLAAHLARQGDTDPADVRRAKALALLADPARACLTLAAPPAPHHPQPADNQSADDPAAGGAEHGAGEQANDGRFTLAARFGRLLADHGPDVIDRLRPRSTLYLHLSTEALDPHTRVPGAQVARTETLGPTTVTQLRDWLGHDHLTIRPVLDPLGQTPVDAYEIPSAHREATHHLAPYEVFPHGTAPARTCDLDHTTPWRTRRDGGPSGQTHPDNLGPLARSRHRLKTFGRWHHHQPLPGLHLWRTPTGCWLRVDHRGTRKLGWTTPAIIRQRTRPTLSPGQLHLTDLHLEVQLART